MIRAVVTAFALFVAGSTSFATSLSPIQVKMFEKGTDRMLLIDGKVDRVSHAVPKCGPPKPGADPCQNVTSIDIKFAVGCVDDIAVTSTASFSKKLGKIYVDVVAMQLANEMSRRVMCAAPNVKVATVYVNSNLPTVSEKDVEVRFQKNFTEVR